MLQQEILWWRVFQQLKEELNYNPSIQKYELLCKTAAKGFIPYEEDFASFLRFCKILLLQNIKDEKQFETIILNVFAKEINTYLRKIDQKIASLEEEIISPLPPPIQDDSVAPIFSPRQSPKTVKPKGKTKSKTPKKQEIIKYFHPELSTNLTDAPKEEESNKSSERYILSNDYLPFTSRQMAKGWQYYRRKQVEGLTDKLDIPATIQEIAKEGFFLNPKYLKDKRNRKDTLIILADFRGSMMPFHEITRELIRTAKEGGGHAKVAVYYFRNIPTGSVFRNPNLSQPIRLEQVFASCNSNYTKAIIISDAGAARMAATTEGIKHRLEETTNFLKMLNTEVSKTIWVNPMPYHRWTNTAAQKIAEIVQMIPVLETDNRLFLNAFKELS